MRKFGSAVILAGGQSTRMGFDKQFLELNNQNIISYLSNELSNIFDDIIVISNTLKDGYYKNFRVVSDVIKEKGPLSGIHSGLLSAHSEYVYFIACDMPNINLDYIQHLINSIKDVSNNPLAIVTRYKNWIEPFNSFYHKDLIPKIEDHLLSNRSIFALIKKVESLLIDEKIARDYAPDWSMFTNLNTIEDVKNFMDEKNKTTSFYEITKYEKGNLIKLKDEVITERIIDLYVNNIFIQTFQCSPKELKELAIGFLLSKKIIFDSSEVSEFIINEERINVKIDKNSKIIQSNLKNIELQKNKNLKEIIFSLTEIIKIMKIFSTFSKTFLNTGAAHSAALFDGSEIVLFTEDIARHNAIDKLIGLANLKKINLKSLAILTSCRISAEIINKIASQKIPLIISQSAPSSLSIEIAKKNNITLIGFARNNRLNIYNKCITLTE